MQIVLVKVVGVEVKLAKNNSKFAILTTVLKNRAQLQFLEWNFNQDPSALLGSTFEITYTADSYRGATSLIVKERKKSIIPLKIDKYIPNKELEAEFREWSKFMEGKYKKIFEELILGTYWEKFSLASAAYSNHHAGPGMLLVHTNRVMKLVYSMYHMYNSVYKLDLSLLLAGAAFHDYGKMFDYVVEEDSGVVSLAPHIALVGHIAKVAMEINHYGIMQVVDYTMLIHCVLGHHQKLEWGSPVNPTIPEAFLVAMADYTDGNMENIDLCRKEMEGTSTFSKKSTTGGNIINSSFAKDE